MAKKIHKTIRGTAEYVGGTSIRYTWPCGHTQTQDHSKGPVTKRFGAWACQFYVRYWAGSGGVNLPLCKRCARKDTP
jgi:hypothetical protein